MLASFSCPTHPTLHALTCCSVHSLVGQLQLPPPPPSIHSLVGQPQRLLHLPEAHVIWVAPTQWVQNLKHNRPALTWQGGSGRQADRSKAGERQAGGQADQAGRQADQAGRQAGRRKAGRQAGRWEGRQAGMSTA